MRSETTGANTFGIPWRTPRRPLASLRDQWSHSSIHPGASCWLYSDCSIFGRFSNCLLGMAWVVRSAKDRRNLILRGNFDPCNNNNLLELLSRQKHTTTLVRSKVFIFRILISSSFHVPSGTMVGVNPKSAPSSIVFIVFRTRNLFIFQNDPIL